MKICFTVDSMKSGGAERVVSILANNFSKCGHSVYILMVSSMEEKSFYDLVDVKLICLMKNYKKRLKFTKRIKLLKATLQNLMPDVVISFLPHVTIYSFFALRHSKIKLICSERNDPSKLSFKYRIFLKHVFKKASGNVFQTDDARKWYKNYVSKNCIKIANPINPAIEYRDIKARSNKIVAVGRLVPQKNFRLLIDSFSQFYKLNAASNYILKIYGDGPMLDELKRFALEKNVLTNVYFLGNSKTWFVDECDAKMFILSSDFEGMPNSLIEALAIGIPCISTKCPVGGPEELISNEQNGLLVPVNNAGDLLLAMEKIKDDNFAAKLSAANKNIVLKYNENKITNQWLSFIEQIIKG